MKIELRNEIISYPDTVVGLLQMIKNSIVHSNSMALPSQYNN